MTNSVVGWMWVEVGNLVRSRKYRCCCWSIVEVFLVLVMEPSRVEVMSSLFDRVGVDLGEDVDVDVMEVLRLDGG